MTLPGEISVLIFTKIPGRAACKTRLGETLGVGGSVLERISTALLADTLEAAASAARRRLWIATAPGCGTQSIADLYIAETSRHGSAPPLPDLLVFAQEGSSFEERLDHALREVWKLETNGVILLGSDTPTISAALLKRASALLRRGTAAIGPTTLGGLYLIGLPARARASDFSFSGIFARRDSTELVELCRRLQKSGLPYRLLEHHQDIDVADDLVTLASSVHAAKHEHTLRREPTPATPPARNTMFVLKELGFRYRRDTDNRNYRVCLNVDEL